MATEPRPHLANVFGSQFVAARDLAGTGNRLWLEPVARSARLMQGQSSLRGGGHARGGGQIHVGGGSFFGGSVDNWDFSHRVHRRGCFRLRGSSTPIHPLLSSVTASQLPLNPGWRARPARHFRRQTAFVDLGEVENLLNRDDFAVCEPLGDAQQARIDVFGPLGQLQASLRRVRHRLDGPVALAEGHFDRSAAHNHA